MYILAILLNELLLLLLTCRNEVQHRHISHDKKTSAKCPARSREIRTTAQIHGTASFGADWNTPHRNHSAFCAYSKALKPIWSWPSFLKSWFRLLQNFNLSLTYLMHYWSVVISVIAQGTPSKAKPGQAQNQIHSSLDRCGFWAQSQNTCLLLHNHGVASELLPLWWW